MAETTCQYCGRDCGNAGAKTQHEDACEANPANGGGGGGDRRPARQTDRQQQGGQPPVTRGGPADAGADVVDSFVALTDEDAPRQARVQGAQGVVGFVAGMWDRYNEYRDAKMNEQDRRAQSVDLKPADVYPECQECGYQFTGDDVGLSAETVQCPECGRVYEVIEQDPEEVPAEPVD